MPEPNPPPTPTLPDQLETLAGLGHSETEAALLLGKTIEQFRRLLADAANAAAWERGRTTADHKVVASLFRNACAGNVQAQQYWLEARQPDRWGKKKQPAATPPDNPAQDCPPPDPRAKIRLT